MPNNTAVSVFGINPYRIGAVEIYCRELSAQLAERGWKSVLCFVAPPPPRVRRFLESSNVSFEVVGDSWKFSRKAVHDLADVLNRHRPRILHLYFTGFLSGFPWLARWYSVEEVFFTDQLSRPAGYVPATSALWKRLLVRGINHPVSKVICVSNYGYRCFTALDLLPKNRFEMIYNSVDLTRARQGLDRGAEFRRNYGIGPDRLVVTQVSSLIPEKGIADLLQVARIVVAKEPRAHFVIVGKGSQAAEYQSMAVQSGLSNHVTFTGVIEDPLGEGVYGAADVVCQLSRWEEVFGYVIAEAMASCRPVVGTLAGGIPELIEDGITGYLFERGNQPLTAERVRSLLADASLRQRMGLAGRHAVEQKFSHNNNVAQVLNLYWGMSGSPSLEADERPLSFSKHTPSSSARYASK